MYKTMIFKHCTVIPKESKQKKRALRSPHLLPVEFQPLYSEGKSRQSLLVFMSWRDRAGNLGGQGNSSFQVRYGEERDPEIHGRSAEVFSWALINIHVSGTNPSPGKKPLERNRGNNHQSSQRVWKRLCSHQPVVNFVTHGELVRVPTRVFSQKINLSSPRIMAALVLPNKS